MNNRKRILTLFLSLVFTTTLICTARLQAQDSVRLDLITITDAYFPTSSTYFDSYDSTRISSTSRNDLGEFIDEFTPIYIRKYGPGLSYSMSVRGSNSGQVEVLWNDLPINSPMQGQTDLALFNLSPGNKLLFDANTYSYGLSGALSIREILPGHPGWKFRFSETISSTKGHNLTAYSSHASKKWTATYFFQGKQDKNQFYYQKAGIRQLIENNAIEQYQGKINFSWSFSPKHRIRASAWYIDSNREIPPSLYENSSDAKQLDRSLRINSTYSYLSNRASIRINSAIFSDRLQYQSLIKSINSDSYSHQWINQLKIQFAPLGKHHFTFSSMNRAMLVESTGYEQNKMINQWNVQAQHIFIPGPNHHVQTGIRLGSRNINESIQWAPYFYYRYNLSSNLQFLFSAGKKFRYPAFNDLFWYQGGNPSLLPEQALEGEIGIAIRLNRSIQFRNRNYIKRVKNWIQWFPVSGVFQAGNIAAVAGAGMENMLTANWTLQNATLQSRLIHQWNKLKHSKGKNEGKSLIYAPEHLVKHHLSVKWKEFIFSINQQFTSKVYTTSDNSSELKDYYLLSSGIKKNWTLKRSTINSWLRIDNVFNTRYFSIENYVMPGRVYELGIEIDF